jgi:hypothetical protein
VQSKNGQESFEGQKQPDVVRAIAAIFEPARQYRERVSRSFEAVHAVRAELQLLAEAVDPLKGVEGSVLEIVDMLRTRSAT